MRNYNIRFRLPDAAIARLEELVATGFYGANISSAARRLCERGLIKLGPSERSEVGGGLGGRGG